MKRMKIYTKVVWDIESIRVIESESYDYDGPVELACGATGGQREIASSQQSFMNQLDSDFASNFGAQSDIYKNLTQSLTPMLEAGPNQQGFSPAENAALNTQAINTTGANYRNAAQAVGGQLAGRGLPGGSGDGSGLESGIDQQIKGNLAGQAAGQLSSEQNQITQANYAQGRQNFFGAEAGLGGVASGLNPTGLAGQATSAGDAAATSANNIAAANAAPWNAVGKLVGGVAGDLIGGPGFNLISGLGGHSSKGQSDAVNGDSAG